MDSFEKMVKNKGKYGINIRPLIDEKFYIYPKAYLFEENCACKRDFGCPKFFSKVLRFEYQESYKVKEYGMRIYLEELKAKLNRVRPTPKRDIVL